MCFSCNRRIEVTEEVLKRTTEISKIGAIIDMNQDWYDNKDNDVIVELYNDEGFEINSEKIKVFVNDVEVPYCLMPKLYYDTSTSYRLKKIPVVNDEFKFEVVLPSGKKYLLGTVKTISEVKMKNVKYNKKGNINEPYQFSWSNMKDFNEMEIYRGMDMPTIENVTISDPDGPSVKHKIKPDGNWTIPTSFYTKPKSKISFLSINFYCTKNGVLNKDILPDSKITIFSEFDVVDVNFK